MNELRKVRGMTEAELRTLLGYADKVASALAEARGLMSTFVGAATLDSARLSMEFASSDLRTVRVMIDEALKPAPWCDGCGDGAPGKVATRHGDEMPCAMCAPACPYAVDTCEGPKSGPDAIRCEECDEARHEHAISRREWERDTYEERSA